MRYALYFLARLITQKPRRSVRIGVDFKWSNKLWTHNVFRVFELLFGVPVIIENGIAYDIIRPSVASWTDEAGKGHQVGYTLEAQIALFEVWVRSLRTRLAFKLILVPRYQLAGMAVDGIRPFPYMLAIAFDAAAGMQNGGALGNLTHTCTGSNLLLTGFINGDLTTDNLTGSTYNSVACTTSKKIQYPSDRWNYQVYLVAPSTGANAFATTGLTFSDKGCASYTGCAQSGQPDSSATKDSSSGGPFASITLTTTVVASNCWLVGGLYGDTTHSGGTGTTLRGTSLASNSITDSNATVSTGSQSLVVNLSVNGNAVGTIMSIAPVATALPSQNSDLVFFN